MACTWMMDGTVDATSHGRPTTELMPIRAPTMMVS
jgi:hypothetical protein